MVELPPTGPSCYDQGQVHQIQSSSYSARRMGSLDGWERMVSLFLVLDVLCGWFLSFLVSKW